MVETYFEALKMLCGLGRVSLLCFCLALISFPAWCELPSPVDYPATLVDLDNPPKGLIEMNSLMGEFSSFKAKFIRSEYPQGVDLPISTGGHMVFDMDRGLLWRVIDPYREALWISQDGVFKLDIAGTKKVFEDPGVFLKLKEFIEGRLKDLATDAQLFFGEKGNSWEVRIIPQGGALAGRIEEIRIRGSRGLFWWIRLLFKDHTVTSIRIYDQQWFKDPINEGEFFDLH